MSKRFLMLNKRSAFFLIIIQFSLLYLWGCPKSAEVSTAPEAQKESSVEVREEKNIGSSWPAVMEGHASERREQVAKGLKGGQIQLNEIEPVTTLDLASILKKYPKGKIDYEGFEKDMEVWNPYKVKVTLYKEEAAKKINKQVEDLKYIGEEMRVELTGSGDEFKINMNGDPSEKSMIGKDKETWTWEVIPQKPSDKGLELTVRVWVVIKFKTNRKDEIQDFEVATKTIKVKTTAYYLINYYILGFIKQYWMPIIGASGTTTLFGWLFKRQQVKKKKRKK